MIKVTLPSGKYIELTEEGALEVQSQIHNQLYMLELRRQRAFNKTYKGKSDAIQTWEDEGGQ